MKKIFFTQRVMIKPDYNERWDCGDQNISSLLSYCGYMPIPVNNNPRLISLLCNNLSPDGILLTGGNSLVKYGGDAPERDETETCLIDYALKKHIPIYGFCRGMQVLQDYFGVRLHKIEGHVAVKHNVSGEWGCIEVNSFHTLGTYNCNDDMVVTMKSDDGTVEAIKFKYYPIVATMWHPERQKPFASHDINRIMALFGQ